MSRPRFAVPALTCLIALVGCASPGEGRQADDPSAFVDEETAAAALVAEAQAATASGSEAGTTEPFVPLASGEPVPPNAAPPVAGAPFPSSVFGMTPFGPAPGSDAGRFGVYSDVVAERYLGRPDAARAEQLDQLLDKADIVAVTPAFLNACIGLDMARREDVETAMAITSGWYVRQARYKQVVLAGRPEVSSPAAVQARLAALDGWRRWWERTLESPDGVERFRQRVREIQAAMRALDPRTRGG